MKSPEVTKIVKSMSFKEKRAYIWDYYKIHIFAILIVIALIASFIYSMSTKQQEYYNITYVGNYISENNLSSMKNNINKAILNNDNKKIITLDSVFTDKQSLSSNPQALEKLAAKITAKDIDIAIVNRKFFESYFSSGIFFNLQSLNGFSSLSKENYKFLTKTNSSNRLGTYGIYVEKSSILNKLSSNSYDNILVVISTSERKNKAIKFLKVLLTK